MAEGFTLDVQDYCSYCGDFLPELMQMEVTSFGDRSRRAMNSISCENAGKCAHLMESLKNRE